jgi:hypothetical protein
MVNLLKILGSLSMTEKHADSKHVRRETEVDGDSATIKFGADVQKSFSDLEAIVRNSPHFDSDLLVNLQELADGKNYSIRSAITNMGYIAQETMQYMHATGDQSVKALLDNLLEQVNGFDKGSSALTVIVPKRKQHR